MAPPPLSPSFDAETTAGTPHVLFRHRLTEPLLRYLEGRGLLLSLETKEALQKVVGMVVVAFVAVILIFAGWLLLATALVGWITVKLHWSWFAAAALTGGGHVLLAALLVGVTWMWFAKAVWFSETLNELKKDRAWLRGSTVKP